jgi:hypothetical protein
VAMSVNSSFQTSVIVTIFLMPAAAFLLLSVYLPLVSATTGIGTSEDIPKGANDPTLPQSSVPDMSNTTSEDIPAGVNDPTLPQSSAANMSNTTSEDIPAGANDPTILLPDS